MISPQISLSGIISSTCFRDEKTGYAAITLHLDDGIPEPYSCNRRVRLTGPLSEIGVGQRLSVTGPLTSHHKHGYAIKVESFVLLEPKDITDIVKYLTHNVKWVGPVYSKKIAEHFGLDTFRILDEEPDRLQEIKGMGKERIENMKTSWADTRSLRGLLMFCTQVGIGNPFVAKIHNVYRDGAVERITRDPYMLARDIHGIGFAKADEVAKKLNVPEVSDIRIRAAARFLVEDQSEANGDCFVWWPELLGKTVEFLKHPDITLEMVTRVVTEAVEKKILVKEANRTYSPDLHRCEVSAAKRTLALIQYPMPAELCGEGLVKATAKAIESTGLELHPVQLDAIHRTMKSKVSVITGGPGTGKTTILKSIVAGYESAGMRVTLLAPTGRAKKRMSEMTGRPASTIHRLLHSLARLVSEGKAELEDVLIRGVVFIDESSMVDISLLNWFLGFLHPSCVLVVIGDEDQLPSIGPGSVLRDLIASRLVASTMLTHIFRQAAESDIIRHAHSINNGVIPQITKLSRELVLARGWPVTDMYMIECDDQSRQASIACWCSTFMASALGFKPLEDVQVLTPMRRGDAGTINLNTQLQRVLNPTPADSLSRPDGGTWGIGDRLMQLRNNYDQGIFNGDHGHIREFVRKNGDVVSIKMDFDGVEVNVGKADFFDMTLAYACTIHKSQGSEYPMVVMCLHTAHYVLLVRNLLFTAATRTRKLAVLICHPQALSMAVNNNRVSKRNTYLTERIDNASNQVFDVQG